MTATQVRPILSRTAAASVAALLALTLSACGGDGSSESSNGPPTNNSAAGQRDQSNSGSDDLDQPDNLSDFPLPDNYTVVTSGSRGGAWTVVLKASTDWEELKTLYRDELSRTGWTIDGERPTAAEEGIHFDASREDMEATVALSSVDGGTDILINVVKA